MTFKEYLRDRRTFLLINVILITAAMAYLLIFDIPVLAISFIAIGWFAAFFIYMFFSFWRRRDYFAGFEGLIEDVPVRQIVPMLDPPPFSEAKPFYRLLTAMGDKTEAELSVSQQQQREYREYIETWVHEIKNPISALKLIIEADRARLGPVTGELGEEILQIENYVEQALYVARAENAEKDYLVREFPVMKAVKEALQKQQQLLVKKSIQVQAINSGITVLSDEKWLGFILAQLLANAIQYGAKAIKIWATEETQGVSLYILDDGFGISEADLPRIFEKGFTGETGRRNEKSTGLGLYLVQSLCEKLEHGIDIASREGRFTRVTLTFPKSSYISLKETITSR